MGAKTTQSFATGATRSADEHKYDFEGFLSPLVLERFGAYMHQHRVQRDGSVRASDNWQAGIPIHKYVKSLVRHTFDLWRAYRGTTVIDKDTNQPVTILDLLMAILFNTQGMALEMLRHNGDDVDCVRDEVRQKIENGQEFSFVPLFTNCVVFSVDKPPSRAHESEYWPVPQEQSRTRDMARVLDEEADELRREIYVRPY